MEHVRQAAWFAGVLRPAASAWDALHRRAARWPWLGDTVAAAVYLIACLTELSGATEPGAPHRSVDTLGVLMVLVGGAALLVQRRIPATAVLVTACVSVTLSTAGWASEDSNTDLASLGTSLGVLFALYALSLRRGRPRSIQVLAAVLVLGAAALMAFGHDNRGLDLVRLVAICCIAWALGDAQRGRRTYTESLRLRAEHLQREQLALAQVAVVQERTRIARELHDVVAHHVSLMIVNAAAADRQLDRDPDTSHRVLGELVVTGQAAVTEMRRLLEVLRSDDHDDGLPPRTPQPTLEQLEELVETFRTADLQVELTVEGRRPLPAGIDLTAYRILQESLTNALRHAGAGTRVQVGVRVGADVLQLDVADDGRGVPAGGVRDVPGHGLIGMRERINMVGGELRVGARPGGGFAVHASLPLPNEDRGQL